MKSFESELNLGDNIKFDDNNLPIPEVEIKKEGT